MSMKDEAEFPDSPTARHHGVRRDQEIERLERAAKVPRYFTKVRDSGERQEFETGSVRDTQAGKGRFDLISPIALKRLAQHYENGALKYEARNWEKGQPIGRYLDSAIRHLYAHLGGDRSEDHLAAAAWNAMAAIHTEVKIAEGLLPAHLSDIEPAVELAHRLFPNEEPK